MTCAADIREALRIRYAPPEWAIFYEVASATGGFGARYADAVAMNLYPSRGLCLHGFEIKVSRGDWLSELRKPTKSDPVQRHCDFWWVVTPKDIVKPDELPVTWGLMEFKGSKLFSVTKAPKLEAAPIDRAFAASLLRRAGQLDEAQRTVALNHERERLRTEFEERATRNRADENVLYQQLKKTVDEFEAASGIQIHRQHNGPRLGKAALELFAGWDSLPNRLKSTKTNLEAAARAVCAALAEFETPAQGETA